MKELTILEKIARAPFIIDALLEDYAKQVSNVENVESKLILDRIYAKAESLRIEFVKNNPKSREEQIRDAANNSEIVKKAIGA